MGGERDGYDLLCPRGNCRQIHLLRVLCSSVLSSTSIEITLHLFALSPVRTNDNKIVIIMAAYL